jgi:tRNA(Ile)-lysidine synthase
MAEAAGARYVVTAHTRDDQAETVLFRLLRGAGLRGLAGMRRFRELSPSVTLVRPLLDVTRAELEGYLHGLGQPWREDATNAIVEFARNRLRHELLPYVREHFNADVDAAIARTASLAAEAQALVENQAADLLARCKPTSRISTTQREIVLSVTPLTGQPRILVGEALRQAWRSAGFPEQTMTHHWWRQLAQLALLPDSLGKLNLPGNVLAHREGELLVLAPPSVP